MAKLFLLILALTLSIYPGVSWPMDDFTRAMNYYEHGDFEKAAGILEGLLHPLRLSDEEEIVKAYKLSGVCRFILKQEDEAGRDFRELLKIRPEASLDPLFFPPEIIEFFERVKQQYTKEITPEAPKKEEIVILPETDIDIRSTPHPLLHTLPFGGGQFMNNRNKKGYLLLVGEALLLSTNISAYYYRKSLENSGTYDNPSRANHIQNIQLTSGYLCIGLMIYGIIDGIWYYYKDIGKQKEKDSRNFTLIFNDKGVGVLVKY